MRSKVCFIVSGVGFSGAENVLVHYLKDNYEIEPYIVVIFDGDVCKKFANIFGEKKTRCLGIRYSKNGLRFFPILSELAVEKELKRVIKEINPDLVYVNNTLEVMMCRMAAQSINLPFIGHVHDMRNAFGTFIKIIEAEKAFRNFDKLLTVSCACRDSWKDSKMEVVYNGVPESYFHLEDDNKDGITIGYVGMISKRKGFDFLCGLINALPQNVNWNIAYNLVEDAFCEELAGLGSRKNVRLNKNVHSSDMPSFYDSIDFLIVPSRQDPLPTVVLEAIARGKLVIGFRIGGIPEMIKDADLIVDEVSGEAILSKMKEVLSWSKDIVRVKEKALYAKTKSGFSESEKKRRVNLIIQECILSK